MKRFRYFKFLLRLLAPNPLWEEGQTLTWNNAYELQKPIIHR